MKLPSILALEEIIKNMKVQTFGKQSQQSAEDGKNQRSGGPEMTTDVEKQNEEARKGQDCGDDSSDNTCGQTDTRSWWLYRASMQVVSLLESGCGMWGRAVAHNPVRTVLFSLFIVCLLGLGLLNVNQEQRPYKLWIPQDSDFAEVNTWKIENFPNKFRRHSVIWEAQGNILTARAVKNMLRLHNRIEKLQVVVEDEIITWNDVCTFVPTLLSELTDEEIDAGVAYDYENVVPANFSTFSWGNNSAFNWTGFDLSNASLYNWTINWENGDYDYDYEGVTTELPGEEADWLTEEERKILNAVTAEVLQSVRDDYSLVMSKPAYCQELAAKKRLCYETSILEIWGYEEEVIRNLTDEQVLRDVNAAFMSKVFGYPLDPKNYLGSIERDSEGRILSAKAALHMWVTKKQENRTMVVDIGTGDTVDSEGLAWEMALVDAVREEDIPGINLHVHAAYSFGDVSAKTIMGDIKWVACGWAALIVYVLVSLGRPCPALVGLFCVALAVVAAYGACSAIGIPHGPLNNVLPILLIGLGVDDMYVISSAWENAGNMKLLDRASRTLQHAGVAITVTSLSDAVAFLVGATTEVPALRWFCIYAAVGVTTVYILQGTVFVAALTADQKYRDKKKAESNQNKPEKPKGPSLLSLAMKSYAQIIVKPWMKATVLLTAATMMGVGVWGAISLRQEFSPVWFLPRTSYLHRWFQTMDEHFPSDGELGTVYFSNLSLPDELPALRELAASLQTSPYVTRVDAWYSVLDVYLLENPDYYNVTMTPEVLHDALGIFLHSRSGAKYNNNFLFEDELTCEDPAPPFSIFKINFQYARLDDRAEQQAAMKQVREIVSSANISGYHAVWAHVYSQWETDAAVGSELWRNLGLVACVVGLMTLLLLAAPRAAFLVLLCVISTLTEVAALMHLWGLTIDTVTCIALVLAIGLCVDYAAHVAHAFLVVGGTKSQRVQAALERVGPAVVHGGFSTMLAFVMLSPSDSHLFISFFKIFIGVSVFGLFHGLVLLPVLLTFLGPEPYPDYTDTSPSVQTEIQPSRETTHGTSAARKTTQPEQSFQPNICRVTNDVVIYISPEERQDSHISPPVVRIENESPVPPVHRDLNAKKDTLKQSCSKGGSSPKSDKSGEREKGHDNPVFEPEC